MMPKPTRSTNTVRKIAAKGPKRFIAASVPAGRLDDLVLCFQRMTHAAPRPSLPGLTRQSILPKDVDARDKPGHDGGGGLSVGVSTLAALGIAAGGAEVAAFLADEGGLAAFWAGRKTLPWLLALGQVGDLAQALRRRLPPGDEADVDHVLLDH